MKMFNLQSSKFKVQGFFLGRRKFDVGSSMFDVRCFRFFPLLLGLWTLDFGLWTPCAHAASSSNAPALARLDFSAFKMITDRNIFNTRRSRDYKPTANWDDSVNPKIQSLLDNNRYNVSNTSGSPSSDELASFKSALRIQSENFSALASTVRDLAMMVKEMRAPSSTNSSQ